MAQFIYTIRTDKDTHFTGALAQHAEEQENVALYAALAGINGKAENVLRSIQIQSDQALSWEIWLWKTDGFSNADLDLDMAIGRWQFGSGDGVQIAGAGQYYYYIDGLGVPYQDDDLTGELHISLVNRSAGAKNAGATGEITVALTFEPMLGFIGGS